MMGAVRIGTEASDWMEQMSTRFPTVSTRGVLTLISEGPYAVISRGLNYEFVCVDIPPRP